MASKRSPSRSSSAKPTSKRRRRGNQSQSPEKSTDAIRLNKYLADASVASRRGADALILEGAVKVNGKIIDELGARVVLSDLVTVHGNPVDAEKHLTYIVLNKPKDVITTAKDEKGRKTVLDLVGGTRERIFPVGRLDRNTTGVLILTNDGDLAYRLMHPKYQIVRQYAVGLDKPLTTAHAQRIARGIEIEGETLKASEVITDTRTPDQVLVFLTEGKNREIRRLFEHLGYAVKKLDRKMYANITHRGLRRGEYRHLTKAEARELERLTGLDNRFASLHKKNRKSQGG